MPNNAGNRFIDSHDLPLKIIMNLIRTLINADECCTPCGIRYGTLRTGIHGHWRGVCPICGQDADLSSTKDWGYLRRGVQMLVEPPQHGDPC
jgi:hypothetical protein